MLRLLLLSLGLIVVTSCPKPPPTMPPKQPTPAPDDIGKLAPPPVTRRTKFGDAVHLDLGEEEAVPRDHTPGGPPDDDGGSQLAAIANGTSCAQARVFATGG